jgi:MAP/microtubule affinity-regulating kinase
LRKFLIRDPLKRPSLDILIGDPWLNEGYEESCISKEISEDLVNEDGLILSVMETKLGIEKASIIEGLKEKTYDDNMAIYFLLYHEKMKNGDGAVIKIGEQIAAKNPLPEKHKEKQEEVVKQTSISVIQEEKSDETTEKPMEQKRPSDDEVSDQSGQMTPILAANNVKRGRRSTISGDSEIPKIQVKPEQSSKQQEMVKKMETVQVKDPSPPSRAVKTERLQAKGRPLSMVNGDRPSLPEPSESDSSSKEQGDKSIKKTDAPRKRTPTITGFLKIGKDKPATKPEPSDDDAGSDGSLEEVGSNQGDSKPRSLRFTFNSNTTSSKEPDTIVQEVLNGCQGIGIKAKLLSRYLVECVSPPPTNLPGAEVVKIEIEICKLPRLKNLHGLRFKRQGGASADYKTVCEQLLAAIKL